VGEVDKKFKDNVKQKLSQKCYTVKMELNQEEAELNRRKIWQLKKLEE